MKKVFALAALAALMALSPLNLFAQDPAVGVQSHQNGNSVSFTVYNDSDSTVCVFPHVSEAINVYGSVVQMIQVKAGEQSVNIGAYAQANQNQDWSVYVTAQYRTGTCA